MLKESFYTWHLLRVLSCPLSLCFLELLLWLRRWQLLSSLTLNSNGQSSFHTLQAALLFGPHSGADVS